MNSIFRHVKAHIDKFDKPNHAKGNQLCGIFRKIEKGQFEEARKMTPLDLLELSNDSLTDGDLINSEDNFLNSIKFLVQIMAKYSCPYGCPLNRSVVTNPMVDLRIRSPDLFATMLNNLSESCCDNCTNANRPEDGPVMTTSFAWTESGPCPFICYPLVHGGQEYPTEQDVPQT